MSVCFAAAVQVLLLDDLLLCFRVCLITEFGEYQPHRWVLVVAQHGLIDEARVDLIDCDDHRVRVVLV